MKIILVRHCETDWNKEERCQGVSDLELNTNGFSQAKKLALYFKDKEVDYVFCSDLKRAKQTLNEINYDQRFKVIYSEKLREMDQGEFEGLSLSYLKEKYSNELRIWRENPENFRLPKGETLGEVRDRSLSYIKYILKDLPSESTVLIVTHNLVIASILCTISNKELKFFADFTTESGAISEASFSNNNLTLDILDFVGHLKLNDKVVKSA
ncbi:histidine phosphatase family protein [bacterium]|jgi:broad specificity phosphatase PhoE|nr:histidine phosphatase family protein [bacterium]MBT3795099.1 histidine phosphatase family protein [bacterium]MBT4634397.1 histidine phosphatase family protein [bacterium]